MIAASGGIGYGKSGESGSGIIGGTGNRGYHNGGQGGRQQSQQGGQGIMERDQIFDQGRDRIRAKNKRHDQLKS